MLWNRLIGLEMTFGLEGLSLMSLAWLIELGWEDWFMIWLFDVVFAFTPIGSSSAVCKFDWFVAGFALLLSNKSIEPDRLYTVSQDNLTWWDSHRSYVRDSRTGKRLSLGMKPLLCDKVGSLLTFLVRIGEMGLILSIRILFAISDSGIFDFQEFDFQKFDFQGLVWNWRFSRRACRPWRSEYLTFWVLNDFAFDQAKTYNNKLK